MSTRPAAPRKHHTAIEIGDVSIMGAGAPRTWIEPAHVPKLQVQMYMSQCHTHSHIY